MYEKKICFSYFWEKPRAKKRELKREMRELMERGKEFIKSEKMFFGR